MGKRGDIDIVEVEKRHEGFVYFIYLIAKTFNPFNYRDLSKVSFVKVWRYFMLLMLMCFIVMIIISIPAFVLMPGKLNSELVKLSSFTITPDLNVSENIEFGSLNLVVANDKEYEMENVLITKDTFYLKNVGCLLSTPACLFMRKPIEINAENAPELVNNKRNMSLWMSFLIMLMLPGILIVMFIYYLLRYFILVFLSSIIVYIISQLLKHDLNYKEVYIMGVFAATVMAILEIIPMVYINVTFIPLFFYFVLFIGSVLLMGHKHKKKW